MDKGIRCHFSSIIANTLKTTWVFIAFVVFSLTDEISSIQESGISSSSAFISIGVFLAIIIAIALFNFFRWRKTFFYVEDGNLVVDKRQLIEQKKTTVKLSSIATVNFQQGIIDRIFNTYRLQIDINSSVTADKTDFNIVLSRSIAEEFKKSLTPDAPDKIDSDGNTVKAKSDDITPIFEFSTDRVIKHGLLSISVGSVVLSAIMLAGVLIAQFQDSSAKSSVFSSIIAILLVVGPILVQCVSPFIRYLNFKIGKQNDKAVISYGLITKRQFSVPLEKINAVVLKQPILARFFNLYYGELISVGMGDEENQQTPVFCLLVTKQELDSILSELAPQFVIKGIGEASPKSAFFPISGPYLVWGLIAIAIASLFHYWWVGVIILAFFLLCAIASHKTKALDILEEKSVITTGIFLKRTIIVPFSKIQNASTKSGPLSRHFGLYKGEVSILSSVTNQTNLVGYFPSDRFDKLFDKMLEFDSVESLKE